MNSEVKKRLECICGKFYSCPPSLCVHRKKCAVYLENKISQIKPVQATQQYKTPVTITQNKLITIMIDALQNTITKQDDNMLEPKVIEPKVALLERSKSPPKISEFCLKTYLNETCKDAINFDEIWDEYILNSDYNKWILCVNNGIEDFILLKNLYIYSYPAGNNFLVDFFCDAFNQIEHTKKPIFCSDY